MNKEFLPKKEQTQEEKERLHGRDLSVLRELSEKFLKEQQEALDLEEMNIEDLVIRPEDKNK